MTPLKVAVIGCGFFGSMHAEIYSNMNGVELATVVDVSLSRAKELAARLLALVIPRTPVGRYPKSSGKKGGTLRRGWTARTAGEAATGSTMDAKAYAAALPVSRQGRNFYVQVINPVEYASYVEFGHRTRGGKGWVNGQYFLTLSEHDLERLTPALIERKLEALLREVFRV